jgi:hypothetical protein
MFMKIFVYLLFFIAIVAVAGFCFFSIATPNIPHTIVKVDIDPRTAFQDANDHDAAPLNDTAPAAP